jgi:hypothetical protein
MNLTKLISDNNLNKKIPAAVLGSAPSVSLVDKVPGNKIKIAVGDLPWRAPELGPYDFWVTANNLFPIPWEEKHAKIIKEINIPTLISCVSQSEINMTNISDQDKCIKMNRIFDYPKIVPYDSVHSTRDSDNLNGRYGCLFNDYLNVGPSIQELLLSKNQSFANSYSSGHTVAIHGFALAVLLNANPIYLTGIEIPQTMNIYKYINNFKKFDYVDESWDQYLKRMIKNYIPRIGKRFMSDFSNETYGKILEDFSIVTSIANDLGINVINLSSSSSLTKIKGIHTIDKI